MWWTRLNRPWFLMDPDEGGGGGAAPAATPSPGGSGGGGAGGTPAPTAGSNPAAAATAAIRGTGATAGTAPTTVNPGLGTPPANQGGTAADPGYLPIREALRQYGYPTEAADDHSALQQLVLRARQADELSQMAQLGQQVMPHMSAFQQWMAERRQASETQRAQAAQWHKPPDFDPSWVNLVTRDDKGNLVPAPGAPPDIVQRLAEARRFQNSFLERFAFDPVSTIKPGVEQIVREVAAQLVQQQVGQFRDTTFGEGFLRENSAWLYDRSGEGQPARDAMGNPVLSPLGKLFRQQLGVAVNLGISDERARAQYAMTVVRNAYLQEQARLQSAGATGEAARQALLRQQQQPGNPQTPPNVAGTVTNATTPVQGVPVRGATKLPLAERMRRGFTAAGVTAETMRSGR